MTPDSPGARPGGGFRSGLARALAAAGLALLAAGCSGPEAGSDFPQAEFPSPGEQVDYAPELVGAPSEEIAEMLRESLSLWRRQEEGAPSLALLRGIARQDEETAKTVLRSYGYYGAEIRTEVEAAPEAEPEPAPERPPRPRLDPRAEGEDPDAAAAPAPPGAVARVIVEPGEPFILESHSLEMQDVPPGPEVPVLDAARLGSPVGGPAAASGILAAEQAAVARLRRRGRPWAEIRDRRAVIDPETATMEVVSRIAPGPYATYGEIRVEGREQVSARYIESYRVWSEGEPVASGALRDYQGELMQTRLFSAVTVDVPEDPPPPGAGEAVPVIVRVEEGPARTVSAGLRYNTDVGPEARAGFIHRNLFNNGERLEIEAELGLERQVLRTDFRKPQFRRPGQDLVASLELRREDSDVYDETGVTLAAGLERELSDVWTVGLGGSLEYSLLDDDAGEERDVVLAGLPGFVRYDDTDDLLNPTEGMRAQLLGGPYGGWNGDRDTEFLHAEIVGSGYLPLDEAHDYVLAGRGRLGSVFSGSLDDVPATHRLYSGGGGSVRGYQERIIGPLDDDNDPVGGRSVLELGAELRAPISGPVGGAVFVEAGSVSRDMTPDFGDGLRVAAGAGVRYYSPVGPIRFDVGVPLNPRDVDDPFAIYLSIGQAW
ncbi:MAG: autotransporter assembly complex protein TamA [Pseudomonadota bacterium]